MTFLIRPLADGDIAAVAQLFSTLARQSFLRDMPAEQAEAFLLANGEDAIRAFRHSGHAYHVAESAGQLLGFIAMREERHLFHLFVDNAAQRRGIARALWERARGGAGGTYTVNASDNALPVYRAFGFVPSAPRQTVRGLSFTPMRADL